MSAHRFKLELNGQVVYGVAFGTEAELEVFLGMRGMRAGVQTFAQSTRPADTVSDEPRTRGRPSFDTAIAAAVTALEAKLAGCDTPSDRARLVLRHLAKSHAAEDLPGARTVIRFLNERAGQKYGQKDRHKSKHEKICRTGGN